MRRGGWDNGKADWKREVLIEWKDLSLPLFSQVRGIISWTRGPA